MSQAALSFVDHLYLRMFADAVMAASVINALRAEGNAVCLVELVLFVLIGWALLFHPFRRVTHFPLITWSLRMSLFPWNHVSERPGDTHTHTLACSVNRHCVVIKERCVLWLNWKGDLYLQRHSHDLRWPSHRRSGTLLCHALPLSTSRWHSWLSYGLFFLNFFAWTDTKRKLSIEKKIAT